MSTKAYWILVVAVAAFTYLYGFRAWLEITLSVAVLAVIPWYFGTRRQGGEKSKLERTLTAAWLWTRRLLCFAGGGLCLWGGVERLFFGGVVWREPFRLFAVALMLFLGIVLIIYGVVGGNGNRQARPRQQD